ncbi:MAG TPA: AMP-binding protein [Nevskiaceae bacterium]
MARIVDEPALQARIQPDAMAVRELASGRSWSYAAWDDAVARTAGLLSQRYDLRAGDRVAVIARNCAEQPLLHLACARLGALFVPLNWRLAGPELEYLLGNCDPKIVFGDEAFLTPLPGYATTVEIAKLRKEIESAAALQTPPFDHEQPSLILYTSGTSGRPKGVLLSERNLAQTAFNFGVLAQVTHRSVFLADAPMFHIIGIVANLRTPLVHGGTALISDGFEPPRTLDRLYDPALRASHYFCVPQMAQMLRSSANFDPSRLGGLTAIFTGGAPHPAANIRAWIRDGIVISDGFGMSETAGTVSHMPLHLPLVDAKAGASGLVPPAIRIRIVDDEGNDVAPGERGELLLKGLNVFSAYWRAPQATADAFTPDGWFRTGDIALQDADGFLYFVDRRKDMFISGGENVYPAEIEAVLAAMPGLRETALVGVADERWGEVGHLVVVASGPDAPDEARIRAFLETRLARYKLPKYVSFTDALPRTGSGKVAKPELRKRLSRASS